MTKAVDPESAQTSGGSARTAQGLVLDRILPYLANRLTFRLNQLLSKDLRKHGLTIANWRILAVLEFNEKATVNELADYAMIEQSTLSRLIARMEADGLLRRDRVEADGRARSISLTTKGRQQYEMVRDLALAHGERAIRGISTDDQLAMERIIASMMHNLETEELL